MNKVFTYSVFCLLLNSFSFPQDYWEALKTPVDVALRRVFYLDSLNLWAAGDSGTIIYSSDKGDTWQIQSSNLQQRIEDIFFLNDSLGWALTWTSDGVFFQSQIMKTTNGGLVWESEDYRHANVLLFSIFFIDSSRGWIGGEPFDLSYTDDGGIEWFPANIDSGSFTYFPIHEVKFSTPQLGFAAGGVNDAVGVVWNTLNGGESWHAYGIGPDRFLDFAFIDTTNVLALSNEVEGAYPMGILQFDLLQSAFSYYEDTVYAIVYGIDIRTEHEIWATLSDTRRDFLFSSDTMKTWKFIPTPDSLIAHDIAFADSLHGIAVCEQGYILRYIPQKPVSVEENPFTEIPNEFSLEQNYPNPFNPSTKIKYTVPSNVKGQMSKVALTVYDILGNEIVTIVDEEQAAGIYEVEFPFKSVFSSSRNITNLPSGVYFYRLQVGSFTSTKKMVYLK